MKFKKGAILHGANSNTNSIELTVKEFDPELELTVKEYDQEILEYKSKANNTKAFGRHRHIRNKNADK
jgi:hypothetical protein